MSLVIWRFLREFGDGEGERVGGFFFDVELLSLCCVGWRSCFRARRVEGGSRNVERGGDEGVRGF